MGKLKLLFFLWGMFYSLLGITASEISLKNWIGEDSSGKFKMIKVDDCLDIVSPDGPGRFAQDSSCPALLRIPLCLIWLRVQDYHLL